MGSEEGGVRMSLEEVVVVSGKSVVVPSISVAWKTMGMP
jgi:hypothetical protein